MGYPLKLSLRYLGSSKRSTVSVSTALAVLGVCLGVAALLTIMSVTGGFQAKFREKVLGVNAHVLVLKHSTEFRNYREIMDSMRQVPGVRNVAPFSINPMMLTHGERTSTGVLVKGVDPEASLGVGLDPSIPPVLDLPRHVVRGEAGECPAPGDLACGVKLLTGLRKEGAKPPTKEETTGSGGGGRVLPSPSGSAFAPLPPGTGAAPEWLREAELRHQQEVEEKNAQAKLDAEKSKASPDDAKKVDAKVADSKKVDPQGEPGADPAHGNVTPSGGYKSVLPDDDDEVLKDLIKDACDDPVAIKSLPGIVIGVSLADNLDLKLGDCVTVTSPTIGFQFSGGAVKAPVAKSFRVMAMFEAGFDQYDSKLVYTDLYEAQAFYDEGDTVTGVEMNIADIDASKEIVEAIRAGLPPGAYRVMDWQELNHGLFTALMIQQVSMSAVLALIILVAAFTVIATLIMVVLEKKREISVLKAMGATEFAILRVFLYQGAIIGGLGTVLGLLIGYGACQTLIVHAFPLDPKVYFISHLPVLIRWQEFAVTGAVATLLCLLATIPPSLYASNIRPADGFREQ